MADGAAGPGDSRAKKQKKTPAPDIHVTGHALRLVREALHTDQHTEYFADQALSQCQATQWVDAMEAELDAQGRQQVEQEDREAEQEWASLRTHAEHRREQGRMDAPEIQGRPIRLGLGAKFLPHSKVAPGVAAIERRLKGKLRRAAEAADEEPMGMRRANDSASGEKHKVAREEDDDEEEEESRASAFKKRSNVAISNVSLGGSKKKKQKRRPSS